MWRVTATVGHALGQPSVSRAQWLTVLLLFFINLINYADRFTIAGVLEDIQLYFDIGDDAAGLLQTVFIFTYMTLAPLFGYLGDRSSRIIILAIGVFMWSMATLLGSFMIKFGWFIVMRAIVGVGESSYITIAPTIISDLFVHELRSAMLAVFYFAIPIGVGFGYIIGSKVAHLTNNWRWALRVTPGLGIITVILILFVKEPERGQSEGLRNLSATAYVEDIKYLVTNRSFMYSTAGFTCAAFIIGALTWWAPKYIYLGYKIQNGNENVTQEYASLRFGAVTILAGILGIPLGSFTSQKLTKRFPNVDPLICATTLILALPIWLGAMFAFADSTVFAFFLVFLCEVLLDMNLPIIADILLYVVVPTRRASASAFQILIVHALGDAGSPYLVGLLSEIIKKRLRPDLFINSGMVTNATTEAVTRNMTTKLNLLSERSVVEDTDFIKFKSLQYALLSTSFLDIIGTIFFLITSVYVVSDRQKASQVTPAET